MTQIYSGNRGGETMAEKKVADATAAETVVRRQMEAQKVTNMETN